MALRKIPMTMQGWGTRLNGESRAKYSIGSPASAAAISNGGIALGVAEGSVPHHDVSVTSAPLFAVNQLEEWGRASGGRRCAP